MALGSFFAREALWRASWRVLRALQRRSTYRPRLVSELPVLQNVDTAVEDLTALGAFPAEAADPSLTSSRPLTIEGQDQHSAPSCTTRSEFQRWYILSDIIAVISDQTCPIGTSGLT